MVVRHCLHGPVLKVDMCQPQLVEHIPLYPNPTPILPRWLATLRRTSVFGIQRSNDLRMAVLRLGCCSIQSSSGPPHAKATHSDDNIVQVCYMNAERVNHPCCLKLVPQLVPAGIRPTNHQTSKLTKARSKSSRLIQRMWVRIFEAANDAVSLASACVLCMHACIRTCMHANTYACLHA